LHSVTFHELWPGHRVASLYPIVPWAGVMMVGFGAGQIWTWPPAERRRWLYRAGAIAFTAFVALRLINGYGDPSPWKAQSTPLFTVFSFLNVSKYPPSLAYLLLTLSGAALGLAWLEGKRLSWTGPFQVLGRVPLFFYLLHLPLIHGIAVALSYLKHGAATWLFQDPFFLRRPPNAAPPGYGYDLPAIYPVWLAVLAILYPLCRAYARFKSGRRHPFWSYL
jgi:uncharacterized membrane protein